MRSAMLCIFLVTASSLAYADDLPKLDPNAGTIFSADHARDLLRQCSRGIPQDVQGTWTPDANQIHELEARLPRALADALKRRNENQNRRVIGRQYGGIVAAGRKIIYVNGFSSGGQAFVVMPAHNSTNGSNVRPVLVCDGGDAFFGAEYDPASKTFSNFEFNGVA